MNETYFIFKNQNNLILVKFKIHLNILKTIIKYTSTPKYKLNMGLFFHPSRSTNFKLLLKKAVQMSSLFTCSASNYAACAENLIESAVAIFLCACFFYAVRAVQRDRHDILDQTDRYLIYSSALQILLCAFYFIAFPQAFMLSTIRSLRLVNELLTT